MSALCQKRTRAPQQTARLFDHLVGVGKQERWHIETIALAALSLFIPFSQCSCSHPFGHRLHQQRERCAEAPFAGRGAPIVAEAHHDEIVRWDDQGPLPARS